jgi:enolase
MTKISSILARRILNSRGDWTVKTSVFLENGLGTTASVPQGKSRGLHEAVSVPAIQAVKNITEKISPSIKGLNPEDQTEIDRRLIELDGTSDKAGLGANTLLAVSLAVARAGALSKNTPLWEYLGNLAGTKPDFPKLFANVINGGVHAGNNLDIQEYIIIPEETNPEKAVEITHLFYNQLREYLKENFGESSINLGDEGGFAPEFKDNIEPFKILEKIREENGFKLQFGIDAAASNINKKPGELFEIYNNLISNYPLSFIEDPFGEEDFENFALLFQKYEGKILICGDDLTVTNVSRMKKAEEYKSVNSVIIKPNQIGTLSETLEAINFARKQGWKVVVSHRSGETNDDFIADLAYAVGAYGIKLGAPARGERVSKYNRFLEILKEIK